MEMLRCCNDIVFVVFFFRFGVLGIIRQATK